MGSWSRAFERVEPGQEPVSAPRDLQIWTNQTMFGLFGGMVFGAYRGILQSRTSAPSPVPANSAVHRMSIFVVREGVFTGARVGLFVSMFSALAIAAHQLHNDGKERPEDFAAAGGITCGLYGGAMRGWRGAIPTAIFGTLISGSAAYAQEKLKEAAGVTNDDDASSSSFFYSGAKEKEQKETEQRVEQTIDKLIERFEDNLQNPPPGEAIRGNQSELSTERPSSDQS